MLVDDRDLWIGTEVGLFRITIPKKALTNKNLKSITRTADHIDLVIQGRDNIYTAVYGIEKTADGRIWLGNWYGIGCFDYGPERVVNHKFYSLTGPLSTIIEVTCLTEDKEKNLWIGTHNNGLYRYAPDAEVVKNFRKSLNASFVSDNIKTIASDQDGNVWIGTFNDGLQKIESSQLYAEEIDFLTYQNNEFQPGSLNSNLIRCLYVSADGLLWIGTLGKGINIFNPHQKRFRTIRIPPSLY